MYGLDFDQWLMPVSQSVYAAGYFIHIKKSILFFDISSHWTYLGAAPASVKKVVFFFVEPARNNFAPP